MNIAIKDKLYINHSISNLYINNIYNFGKHTQRIKRKNYLIKKLISNTE